MKRQTSKGKECIPSVPNVFQNSKRKIRLPKTAGSIAEHNGVVVHKIKIVREHQIVDPTGKQQFVGAWTTQNKQTGRLSTSKSLQKKITRKCAFYSDSIPKLHQYAVYLFQNPHEKFQALSRWQQNGRHRSDECQAGVHNTPSCVASDLKKFNSNQKANQNKKFHNLRNLCALSMGEFFGFCHPQSSHTSHPLCTCTGCLWWQNCIFIIKFNFFLIQINSSLKTIHRITWIFHNNGFGSDQLPLQ